MTKSKFSQISNLLRKKGEYTIADELDKLIKEAQSDFGLDRPLIWSKEDMKKLLSKEEALTSTEKNFISLSIKVINWIGTSEKTT